MANVTDCGHGKTNILELAAVFASKAEINVFDVFFFKRSCLKGNMTIHICYYIGRNVKRAPKIVIPVMSLGRINSIKNLHL